VQFREGVNNLKRIIGMAMEKHNLIALIYGEII
jgi:hypothetical protein